MPVISTLSPHSFVSYWETTLVLFIRVVPKSNLGSARRFTICLPQNDAYDRGRYYGKDDNHGDPSGVRTSLAQLFACFTGSSLKPSLLNWSRRWEQRWSRGWNVGWLDARNRTRLAISTGAWPCTRKKAGRIAWYYAWKVAWYCTRWRTGG